jgi:hypothetical protein
MHNGDDGGDRDDGAGPPGDETRDTDRRSAGAGNHTADAGPDLVATIHESLAPETAAVFDERVADQAERIAADAEAGSLDSEGFAVGLELEAYVVDATGRLRVVPGGASDAGGFAPELGLHNLELNTAPDRLSPAGLARQATRLRTAVHDARTAIGEAATDADGSPAPGVRPVLDSMWTVPPAEGSAGYLEAGGEQDGCWVAANMARKPRYHALDEAIRRKAGGQLRLAVPGVERVFPSILVESLATSVQPHLQLPAAADLPRYLGYATRVLGPTLALTANSPFLPADLYPEAVDPSVVLDGPHELRVPVYEQSINAPDGPAKVRVPSDVDSARGAVEAIVADATAAPFLTDPDEVPADAPYRDRFPEFAHKHGTFWRWVRPVFGGDPARDGNGPAPGANDQSVRLEFRPLPTQPTVRDNVACQALVAGLLRGLDEAGHPLLELPWEAARESFYAAVADGPEADLAWVTADGDRTDDRAVVFDELFTYARRGLAAAGFDEAEAAGWLEPLEARREAGQSPSGWKKRRVRDGLDHGESFHEAVVRMQVEYVELSEATDSFAEWL